MKKAKIVNGTRVIAAYLTLRNVSEVMNPMKLAFESSKLSVRVVDEMGNELPQPASMPYSGGRYQSSELLLPYDSTLTFNVSQSGLGIPKNKAALLDFGPENCWIIDVPDGKKKYFLMATLTVEESKRADGELYWHGTLKIPKAEIPLKD